MIKKFIFLFLLVFGLWYSQTTPQQMVSSMGTGINVGNILSAPYEGNWAAPLTETYIDNISRLGFKTVRIPIRFDKQTTALSAVTYTNGSTYIGSPSQYSVNSTYLNRISTILDWCTSRNLIAIIDVHGDSWFWGSFNPSNTEYKTGNDRLAAIDRFKAIWRDISTTFQNKPDTVLFEIMNEAYFDMSATDVDNINAQILAIIRQTNPTRNVIVNGGGINSWEAPMAMSDTFLQSDSHLIATFHYYLPFKFTSASSTTNPVTTWGSSADKSTVDTHFNNVKTWSTQKNIPVLLGEFGADNTDGYDYSTGLPGTIGPDNASRLAYHQYVAEAARSRGFGLTVWDAGEKSSKTIYLNSTESWVKDVRNAVLNSTCTNQTFINNANIGCNYDYNWSLSNSGSAMAKVNNASPTDAYQGTQSLNVNVTAASGNLGDVVLSNNVFSSGFTLGQAYTIRFYAKSDANQQVMLRMKKVSTSNVTSYIDMSTFSLTNNYSQYSTSFTVDSNTVSLQLQILIGKATGNVYLDNFEVVLGALGTQESTPHEKIIEVFPNPAKDYFEIKTSEKILAVEIYSPEGRKVNFIKNENQYHIPGINSGWYWVKVKTPGKTISKKILIN